MVGGGAAGAVRHCCASCNRCPCASAQRLPKPYEDANAWFALVDVDESGGLSRQEIHDALKAQLDIDESIARACANSAGGIKWGRGTPLCV